MPRQLGRSAVRCQYGRGPVAGLFDAIRFLVVDVVAVMVLTRVLAPHPPPIRVMVGVLMPIVVMRCRLTRMRFG